MTELAALNVRLQGDASDLRAALQSAEDGLEGVQAQARQTQRAATGVTGNMGRLSQAFQRNSFAISNTANQFSDLAVQIGAGVSPSRALSQQLPQMTAMMGPLATVIGVASGVLIGLAGNFLAARDNAMTLEERIDQLTESLSRAEDGLGGMGDALGNLITLGGNYGEAAREIARLNRELATMEAISGLNGTVDALNDANPLLRDFRRGLVAVGEAQAELAAFQASGAVPDWLSGATFEALADQDVIDRITQRISQFGDALDATAAQMGMSTAEAGQLATALEQVETAQGVQAQADAARELRETFLATAGNARQLTEEEQQFLAALMQVEQVALRIQAIEQSRAAAVEESAQSLERQLELEQLAARYGEDSLAVMRQRNAHAREDLRLRLENLGATDAEIDRQVELLRNQQEIVERTRQASELMEQLGGQELSVIDQINTLAAALNTSNAEAATLLARLGMISAPGRTTGIIGPEPGRGAPSDPTSSFATGLPPASGTGGATGGGGGGANPLAGQLEQLQQSLMTAEEVELQSHQRRQQMLQDALDQQLLTRERYNELFAQLQEQHQQRMSQIDVYRYGSALDQAQAFFGDMASALEGGNARMERAARAFAAVETLINAWRAHNQVLADPKLPFFAKIPAALSILSAGMGAVQAVKGGGGGGGGASSASASGGGAAAVPTQNIMIDLVGDTFSRGSVQSLFEQINEGLRNGERIEGIMVR